MRNYLDINTTPRNAFLAVVHYHADGRLGCLSFILQDQLTWWGSPAWRGMPWADCGHYAELRLMQASGFTYCEDCATGRKLPYEGLQKLSCPKCALCMHVEQEPLEGDIGSCPRCATDIRYEGDRFVLPTPAQLQTHWAEIQAYLRRDVH